MPETLPARKLWRSSAPRWRDEGQDRENDPMAKRGSLIALALGAAVVWVGKDIPRKMGAKAKGARLARMQASPQYAEGKFRNSVPATEVPAASIPSIALASLSGRDAR